MQGTIKTYLPEKKYGFIKGDDGKDYFFHENQFGDKTHIGKLCEEAIVCFDQQATPKGYKAKNCSLVNASEVQSYVVPDSFITSKSNGVRGWDIIEHSDWIVLGSSSYSPDSAKQDVIDSARQIGANALINLEYFKTTGSEAGTGNGTYHYTIHNFRGRAVTLAKRNFKGNYRADDLLGLNARAEALKNKLIKKTTVSKRIRNIIWLIILFLSFLSVGTMPILIIAFIFIGIKFVRSTNYDYWLKKA
ncbi:cold shock domain-containing protein [Vibrio metschnikovii]|uniref:cold-shock protein n=1 Tax=Vibrio metschnikovii TaxID=28172 RepID=UPI001C308FA7|nr:cold shock domain-containing protein [Vibrio metschnikovii]EKO3674173.1 cold shock domain-containing protein [Vibrio metschnikovii]EKO3895487.1 cold shock domain-containing protein [Vibrio metschnikovii]EKO3926058.1 cold shock domain-containing protein [Vibrio metschnikovii]